MKNKLLLLFFAATTAFIISCEKDTFLSETSELGNIATRTSDTGSEEVLTGGGGGLRPDCRRGRQIDPARLPQAIHDDIAANHAGVDIRGAVIRDGRVRTFAVALTDGTVLIFSANGRFLSECDFTPRTPRDSIWTGPRDSIPHGPRDTIRTGPHGPRDSIVRGGPGRGPGRDRGPR